MIHFLVKVILGLTCQTEGSDKSICLARARPCVQTPVPPKQIKKKYEPLCDIKKHGNFIRPIEHSDLLRIL
jgi:hypothetical protein